MKPELVVMSAALGFFLSSLLLSYEPNCPYRSSATAFSQRASFGWHARGSRDENRGGMRILLYSKTQKRLLHSEEATGGRFVPKTGDNEFIPGEPGGPPVAPSRTLGYVLLATVPLVWGTYGPSVAMLYELDPPVPSLVFSAAYLTMAGVSSLAFLVVPQFQLIDADNSYDSSVESTLVSRDAVLAGLELGTWLFVGGTLQLFGLKTTAAYRSGFLMQLTTIFVPIMEAVGKGDIRAVTPRTWGACALALAGITALSADTVATMASETLVNGPSTGDALSVGAALCYALHVVRLGKWASKVPPFTLSASKAITEMVLALAFVGGLAFASGNNSGGLLHDLGLEIVEYWQAITKSLSDHTIERGYITTCVGITIWSSWVIMLYVLLAQSYGQRFATPSEANLIYSSQPLFTVFFAYVLLGETMDNSGIAGAALLGTAIALVATQSFDSKEHLPED